MSSAQMTEVVKPPPDIKELIEFDSFLCSKKDISKYLKCISQPLKIPDQLKHLKRVKNVGDQLQVLLAPSYMKRESYDEFGIESNQIIKVNVPRHPAITREDYDYSRSIWPCGFYPIPPRMVIKDEEIEYYKEIMRMCIDLAEENGKKGGLGLAGAVLDPTGKLIHLGCDRRKNNMIKHCCFTMIDDICQKRMRTERKPLNPSENATKSDGSIIIPTKRPLVVEEEQFDENVYLLTDMTVLLTKEPCSMCSMALLHSRIKMCIYGDRDVDYGGIGGRTSIHNEEYTNHRFRVFYGLLGEECREVWNKYAMNNKYNIP